MLMSIKKPSPLGLFQPIRLWDRRSGATAFTPQRVLPRQRGKTARERPVTEFKFVKRFPIPRISTILPKTEADGGGYVSWCTVGQQTLVVRDVGVVSAHQH